MIRQYDYIPLFTRLDVKKKFFITGGLGYIGSYFAREALKMGHDVLLYDSLIYEQDYRTILDEIAAEKTPDADLQFVIGDNRNMELLRRSVTGFAPDYILHLAELSSVYSCDHNPPYTEDINFRASSNVINLGEELNIPILYNSSSSIYGNCKEQRLMTEKDQVPAPTDNYCKYKLKMESYIIEKKEKNPDFKIIVFRPATVCGLAPRMRLELLPNHFTYCAMAKGLLRVSELNAYRASIDIADLVAGYFKVIKKGSWKHLIYNIGHQNMSKMQFSTGIQSVVHCKIAPIADIGDLRNLQIDCSLFNKEFDFKPMIEYEETIRNVAVWLDKNIVEIERSNFAGIINMSLENWRKII